MMHPAVDAAPGTSHPPPIYHLSQHSTLSLALVHSNVHQLLALQQDRHVAAADSCAVDAGEMADAGCDDVNRAAVIDSAIVVAASAH
jgi:hypothetical protein